MLRGARYRTVSRRFLCARFIGTAESRARQAGGIDESCTRNIGYSVAARCQRRRAGRWFGQWRHWLASSWRERLARHRRVHEDMSAFLLMVKSEEQTSELQSLMRISYAVFC